MASKPIELEAYEAGVHRALKLATPQNLSDLIYEIKVLNMDEVARKLYVIRREHVRNVRSQVCVAPITDYVQSRLPIVTRNDF